MPSIQFDHYVIAHRGASSVAPENTLAAFLKAKELGAQWVEFDVMLTSCGEAVVIHDETLDRTTNGTGRVCDFPYSYIQTLDAGSWFDPAFANERVPTFKEVIALLHEQRLAANVEIKAVAGQEEAVVNKVLSDIKKYWTRDMTPPLISSFSLPVLECVRRNSADALIGLLMDHWLPDWEMLCDQLDCIAVDINHQLLTPEIANRIKATYRYIFSYTVNDNARAQELFSWGVDAVFSDDVIAILNK